MLAALEIAQDFGADPHQVGGSVDIYCTRYQHRGPGAHTLLRCCLQASRNCSWSIAGGEAQYYNVNVGAAVSSMCEMVNLRENADDSDIDSTAKDDAATKHEVMHPPYSAVEHMVSSISSVNAMTLKSFSLVYNCMHTTHRLRPALPKRFWKRCRVLRCYPPVR